MSACDCAGDALRPVDEAIGELLARAPAPPTPPAGAPPTPPPPPRQTSAVCGMSWRVSVSRK